MIFVHSPYENILFRSNGKGNFFHELTENSKYIYQPNQSSSSYEFLYICAEYVFLSGFELRTFKLESTAPLFWSGSQPITVHG